MKKKGDDADSRRVNNIDLSAIRDSRKRFEEEEGGHHHVDKLIEGEYRLEGSPAFTGKIHTDLSNFVVTSDEPKILGGMGVQPSPLSYLLFGVLACYANSLAIQCGLKGIRLKRMKLKGHLLYDVGPMLTNIDSPLIKELKIEVEADREIGEAIDLTNERCPALYAIDHGIKTEVLQVKTGRARR
jgi:uncharacterized OsmC-like protein